MKTTKHHDDGLEWLRNLRRKIAEDCGQDLAKQADVYRRAAVKHAYKVYRGETAVVGSKRSLKTAA